MTHMRPNVLLASHGVPHKYDMWKGDEFSVHEEEVNKKVPHPYVVT